MKDSRNYKKWMLKAQELLTSTEYKVFTIWFDDSPDFSAGASWLAKSLKIQRQHITRALLSIEKKGLFKLDPSKAKRSWKNKGKSVPHYRLNYEMIDIFLNEPIPRNNEPNNAKSKNDHKKLVH